MKKSIMKSVANETIVKILDIIFFIGFSLFILILRPSFDDYLTPRTILLQMIIGAAIVFFARWVFGVYITVKKYDRVTLLARLVASDIVSVGLIYIAQLFLYYTDRIEIITIFLIIILPLLCSIMLRWTQYYLDKKSIDLTEVIPFSPPDISELEIQEVVKALRSGWITTGPRTKLLEKRLAAYLGVNKCACLNSNTACAEMALRILGIGPGDEVITCAYTYTASASVVVHVGAKLVLIDCNTDDESIEMDYNALEDAITPNTKAIIPVDIAGIPCDYDKIYEIINRKKSIFNPKTAIQKMIGRIAIVEDAAHALGAKYKGKMIGTVADFTNFSFHAVKNFTTGEGGAITWKSIVGIDDEEIYKQIQLFSLHGQSKDAFSKTNKGGWEYDIVGPWYKCNMTDIAAAIGLAQLDRYSQMLSRRKRIIQKYDKTCKKNGLNVLNHFSKERKSSGHLYIVRISGINGEIRDKIIEAMAAKNISCNVHYKPLPMMTAYKELSFNISDYQNAYKKYINEITLPLYSTLTDEQVDYIIKEFVAVVNEYVSDLN